MATGLTRKNVTETVALHRAYFATDVTRTYAWRRQQLDALERLLTERASDIADALHADLHKHPTESEITEIGFVLAELRFTKRRLRRWMRGSRERVPLALVPATARTVPQPLGAVLIVGPWNYPLQLLLAPLVGALAAGNTVVIKPSELAPATSQVLARLIPEYLDRQAVAVMEGGPEVSGWLLDQPWDHIFFTGGSRVAKIVAEKAARHLTPVTLELGGKSPVFVDGTGNLRAVARRIAWAKFINAGQTCVAPDYVLVTPDVQDRLQVELASAVRELYGDDPEKSADYGRIISTDHNLRLTSMLRLGTVVSGGRKEVGSRYLEPTILADVLPTSTVMTEEIFGPVLPVVSIADADAAIAFINERDKPLALYVMSARRSVRRAFLERTSSGALDINVGAAHLSVPGLPFGGVGASGMGAYHGKRTFDIFSHQRAVLSKPLSPDTLRLIYPPYTPRKSRFADTLLRRLS
jgi:aldehyde dehydrogenase (NAD+)